MEFRVDIEGLESFAKKGAEYAKIAEKELGIALDASIRMVHASADKSIASGAKTGRLYRRGKKTHRASAPGEAPATDTGDLRKNLRSRTDTAKMEATVSVKVLSQGKSKTNYAYELEFGNSKVAARPFLFPALEKNKPAIRQRMAKGLDRAAAKAAKK